LERKRQKKEGQAGTEISKGQTNLSRPMSVEHYGVLRNDDPKRQEASKKGGEGWTKKGGLVRQRKLPREAEDSCARWGTLR